MELDEVFAAADAELAAVIALREAAFAATDGQAGRIEAVLGEDIVPLQASAMERAACDAEVGWLSEMPEACARIVRALDAAKPYYVLTSQEPVPQETRRLGFLARFSRAKVTEGLQDERPSPEIAQAAFSGRETRLASAFSMLDEAILRSTARRKELDAFVFRFQEAALATAKAMRGSPPDKTARAVFAAEEMATVLADHAAALALHGRVLSSVDRTPQGIEDEIAAAAEAEMDRILIEEEAV